MEFNEAATRRNIQALRTGMEGSSYPPRPAKEWRNFWNISNIGALVLARAPGPQNKMVGLLYTGALGTFLGMRHAWVPR